MKSGIYSIINIKNQKIYIGSAVDVKKRLREHKSLFKRNKHHNSHFQHSWNLYSELNFQFNVVEFCDKSLIKNREKFYIDLFDSKNPEKGYNINDPDNGFLGIKHTDDTKKKLSIQKIGSNNPMFGKTGEQHHNFGVVMSEEQKEKISKNRKGKGGKKGELSPVSKLTSTQIQEIRSKYIPRVYSSNRLALEYGVSRPTISLIVNNKRWTHI